MGEERVTSERERRAAPARARAGAWCLAAAAVAAMGLGAMATGVRPAAEGAGEETAPGATGARAALVIRDVRVFDGEKVLPRVTVVVRDGTIAAVGPEVQAPPGAEVVDGRGRTLLPGLIDAHVHAFGPALKRALLFGVTTELDMFSDPRMLPGLQRQQETAEVLERADLFSAGVLATAPGGHGTQFGQAIPTLTDPSQAAAWVDERVAEGSDFIKAVYEDGSLYGRALPSLSPETLRAVIAAAHDRGLLAVVHVSTAEGARIALTAGADGLAHLFLDRPADAELVRLAVDGGAFVIPTLTVLESVTGVPSGASLTEDPDLAPYLDRDDRRSLRSFFPFERGLSLATAFASVVKLHAAGVPILAGTDAPNPGTTHGASIHRELELLVAAGLTPSEALAAATSVPAAAFGLEDRGRIAPGLLADLVLVEGDPTADVRATRRIVRIWRRGHAVERPVEEAEDEAPAVPAPGAEAPGPGPVADFESGEVAAAYGFGWQASTDQMMGGASKVELAVVPGGAAGSGLSLESTGVIRPGAMYPWAGPIFFPGARPMTPVDLAGVSALVFWTRGDGGSYAVMVFADSLGMVPAVAPFEAGAEWREVVLPLEETFGLSGEGIRGVLFSATEGEFRFRIDEVAFR